MDKRVVFGVFFLLALAGGAIAETPAAGEAAGEAVVAGAGESASWNYIAAALAVGVACIGGGMAVGKLGAAAMGAIAEDPSLSGKALPYLGLAESICLWGFLVALLILML